MKKRFVLIISGIAAAAMLTFGLTYLTTAGEKDRDAAVNEKNTADEEIRSCCSEESAEESSGSSVYQLESEWRTQDGKEFTLDKLEGRPVVMTMFFASCTYACPILVNDMKKIESSLSAEEFKDYRFVLASIDPERDTPEKLKEFASRWNLDLSRWTLLTGDKDDIMELAAVLGFKYRKEPDGQYSHSNMIMVLNEAGEIAHQHVGLNQDLTAAVTALKNL